MSISSYALNLTIDSNSLSMLRTVGVNIIIAKPVQGQVNPNVAWLAINPFESNTITWQEIYGMYASPAQQLQNGATITRVSQAPQAQEASYYSFDSSATFKGPFTGSDAPGIGQYRVNNNMPTTLYPSLTFGLQQAATVGTTSIAPTPLNAQLVPAAFTATFTPLVTVYVWLQANITSGTVITDVTNKATIVTFGGEITSQKLVYNPATGTFIPQATTGEFLALDMKPSKATPHLRLHKPSGIY